MLFLQMHGYPDMVGPPGCRPLPPGPHPPPPHDLLYGPPPDHLLGHPDHLGPPDSCRPPHEGDWSQDGPVHGPPGSDIYAPGPENDREFTYLDTSDDSGRHTGPDQPSP